MLKGLALIFVLAVLFAVPALAVGKNSISLATVSAATTTTAVSTPSFGSSVTFAVQTNDSTPYVNLQCRQNGSLVYAATRAYWGSYPTSFTLALPLDSNGWGWTSGGADCTAGLWHFGGSNSKLLASTTFTVAP